MIEYDVVNIFQKTATNLSNISPLSLKWESWYNTQIKSALNVTVSGIFRLPIVQCRIFSRPNRPYYCLMNNSQHQPAKMFSGSQLEIRFYNFLVFPQEYLYASKNYYT